MIRIFNPEVYISVDVESTGPIPGKYSMYQLGACKVWEHDKNFLIDIALLNDNFVDTALEACHVTIEGLKARGDAPEVAMAKFNDWIAETARDSRPIFIGFGASYDWSFVNWYFHNFMSKNPFGINGLDIKAYYAGMMATDWGATIKKRIEKQFLSERKHTHNGLDDAIEQAEMFEKMWQYNKMMREAGCWILISG